MQKISSKLVVIVLVVLVSLIAAFVVTYFQLQDHFKKVQAGNALIQTKSTNYTSWISETLAKYPFDSVTKTGAVRDTNFGNRISFIGKLAELTDDQVTLSLKNEQISLNLSPAVTFNSFDKTKGLSGFNGIQKNEIKTNDYVALLVQDNVEEIVVYQIQKLIQ